MPGALVTGAAGGLGLAIAKRLAGRGYTVHLTDVDSERVAAAVAELGGSCWASGLDVADAGACAAAAAATAERAGSLDVWVNNAGILRTGVVYEQDPALHRAMLDVNALGTFNGTRAALELMVPAGRGDVINVISLAGLVAAPGEVAYSASKHAAIAYSIGTLADLRRSGVKGVNVSCICPDGIWSPMLEEKVNDPEAAASWSGVMLMPDQVAARAERLLDRPRAVVAIPRWRGAFVRIFDAFPGLAVRLIPLVLRDARRKQAKFRRQLEAGKWPPKR